MLKYLSIPLSILLVFTVACGEVQQPQDEAVETPAEVPVTSTSEPTGPCLAWKYKNGLPVETPDRGKLPDLAPALVEQLNACLARPSMLRLGELNGDTLNLRISREEYLAASDSSHNTQEFLMSVALTVSELEGVRYVKYIYPTNKQEMPDLFDREALLATE